MKILEIKEPPDSERCSKRQQQDVSSIKKKLLSTLQQCFETRRNEIRCERNCLWANIVSHIGIHIDTHRTRFKGENNNGANAKGDHKQKAETQNTRNKKSLLMLCLLLLKPDIVNGNGPAPGSQSVQMGDAVNITKVPDCTLKLKLLNGTGEPRCSPVDLEDQEKCTFDKGIFTPTDSCFNLVYSDGYIWKLNITAPFSYCVEKSCSSSVESGQINVDTSNNLVFTTPATSSDTTSQHTSTAREATTEDSNRVNLVSPAWRSSTIGLICLICFILLSCSIYCCMTWNKKRPQVNRSTESSNEQRSQETISMLNGGSGDEKSQSIADDGSPEGKPLAHSSSSGISSQSTEDWLMEVVTDG